MTSLTMRNSLIGLVIILGSTTLGSTDAYALGGWPFLHRGCRNGCCDSHKGGAHFHHGGNCCPRRHCLGSLFGWLKHDRRCCFQSECRSGCVRYKHTGSVYADREIRIRVHVPPTHRQIVRTHRRVVPPPGTLGWTYRKPSRPVPAHEHPRTGMLDVYNLPKKCAVAVDRMKGYRGNDGVWHFTSERPLVPGVPHIVTVRAQMLRKGRLVEDVRVVRLIRSRIVDLTY